MRNEIRYFEATRLKYQLKNAEQISTLKITRKNKDKVNILDCIYCGLENFNINGQTVYNNPVLKKYLYNFNRIKFTYYNILSYYLSEYEYKTEEKIYYLKNFIDESYDNNDFLLIGKHRLTNKKETKETYRRRINTIINKMTSPGTTRSQLYLITQIIPNRYGGHKISENYKRFINTYLLAYNDPAFSAIRENKHETITFYQYENLVHIFKDNITTSSKKYKDIQLYALEERFNFELIKSVCKAVHIFGETLKQHSKEDETKKSVFSTNLLKIGVLCDFNLRNEFIELFLNSESEKDYIPILNTMESVNELIQLFICYSRYLIENTYAMDEIYESMDEEMKQFQLKYSGNDSYNTNEYAYSNSYCNDYKLNIDFTEEDFKIVMESLKKYNKIQMLEYLCIEEKNSLKVACAFNSKISLHEIVVKYQIEESEVTRLIKKYKNWHKIFNNSNKNANINIILDEYRKMLKMVTEESKLVYKIVGDLGAGFTVTQLIDKYKLEIRKKLKNNEINNIDIISIESYILKIIPDYIKEIYILADFAEEISNNEIMAKYHITESEINRYITKEIISLKMTDDFKKDINISISDLAIKYKIKKSSIKSYIDKESIWSKMCADHSLNPETTINELAIKYNLSKNSVRKYIVLSVPPEYSPRKKP